YCQAWHLTWDGVPLFPEKIEAWAGGPVVPDLYQWHRGEYSVDGWARGDAAKLGESERASVEAVVSAYGRLSGRQLSQLTHSEAPWRDARGGLGSGDRGSAVISLNTMREYYSGLDSDEAATPVDELATTGVGAA
ncbi:phage-associated protein, partial [mine drainage metagenome]